MLKPSVFLISLIWLSVSSNAQIKNIGLSFIHNYPKNEYMAGSQTWDMVQDNRGFIYFANNDGILEFDGVNWRVYRTLNQSVVRSVAIGNDQLVYAGAYNELGFLKQVKNGKLVYQSLVDKIPQEFRNFGEIWKIYQTTFGIIFQSYNYILIYRNDKFTAIKPYSQFGFSFYFNGTYYVVDKEKGILQFKRGVLTPIINQSDIFREDEIRFILPKDDSILIGLLNHGLFILKNESLLPWNSPVNEFMLRSQTFSGISLSSGYYAFGTIRDGFFVTDKDGEIIQHMNRTTGLQNNTVLSLFTDNLGNIWAGLDNGISYTEISSPATLINHYFGIEAGYVSLIHNKILYLGTNQGLFACDVPKLPNSTGNNNFKLIDGTQGQVWTLFPAGNSLLCGHNNGTFLIDKYTATKISSVRGVWKFIPLENKPDELFAGTYTGIIVFKNTNKQGWKFSHSVKGFFESCKDLIEDSDGNILVSHGYKGIYRLELNENADSITRVILYNRYSGLPEQLPYELQKIFGEIIVTTVKGCFVFDKKTGKFIPSERYNTFFGNNIPINRLYLDSMTNIWYAGQAKMGVYRILEDGNYREVSTPFYKFSSNIIPAFEHIYPYNEHNVFIGVQDGFIHYDPTVVKKYNKTYPIYIREVRYLKKYTDSIISYKGNLSPSEEENNKDITYIIKYSANSLGFRFAAPFFEDPDKTEYRCRLKGYSNDWGQWGVRTMQEYTNLHEGIYTFEVQARNIYKTLSTTDTFTFRVLPPFHRSGLAYILYVLLFISLVIANIFYFKRRIDRTRLKEKLIHEHRLLLQEQQFREESLITEKKIEHLKNDRLQTEMKHKNKELANSTMYIIQKNKVLNALKEELNGVINAPTADNNRSRIKQLIRKIDKDINNEKYFKVFDTYFDDVHQDFLKRLKEKHPELTPKELRLCAYIRMNISSKEIASLFNISIRGVEVSRYRLRKKLSIEHETNLTEYILNL